VELRSAEIIAELIADAKDVVAEASRGTKFFLPLDQDRLAYFDAVATSEAPIDVLGEGVLADIALTRVMDQMEAVAPRYADIAMLPGASGGTA
jgi:hypothetical protein